MYQYLKGSYFSKNIFLIGIFFLPSAPSIAFLLLLISSFFCIKNNFNKLGKDKWNLTFIFSAILLPIISLLQTDKIIPLVNNWDKSLTWIGLSNWMLLIYFFISFQFFVKTAEDRKKVAKILIAGSFPVLISGFLQYFLKIYGPFEIFNGFIIWFQRPLQHDTGLTSLFNNQNYAGSWFCIIWPLTLAAFLEALKKKLDKYICLFILISITTALILTTSRNAWAGLILLVPLMTGISSLTYLIPIFLLVLLLVFLAVSNLVPENLQNQVLNIFPNRIWQEFSPDNFEGRESRVDIWKNAILFISNRPIIGWGAAAFPVLYFFETKAYVGHAHNLIFELAISYGIPITILIFGSIFLICIISFSKIFIEKSHMKTDFFDRAWFSSFFVLLCSQLVDIQYFDGRISVIFWILLAGLKEISKHDSSIEKA